MIEAPLAFYRSDQSEAMCDRPDRHRAGLGVRDLIIHFVPKL